MIHCGKYRGIRTLEELRDHPWRDVLVKVAAGEEDELAALRGRMEDLPGPAAEGREAGAKEKKKEDARGREKKTNNVGA